MDKLQMTFSSQLSQRMSCLKYIVFIVLFKFSNVIPCEISKWYAYKLVQFYSLCPQLMIHKVRCLLYVESSVCACVCTIQNVLNCY